MIVNAHLCLSYNKIALISDNSYNIKIVTFILEMKMNDIFESILYDFYEMFKNTR